MRYSLAQSLRTEDDDKMMIMPKVNVTRVDNHIYFYDEINEESHRVFLQLFEEAKQFIYSSNGANMFEKGRLEQGVVIHINSPGGYCTDTLAMYDFLKEQDIPIMGIVEGLAASGASVLLCGCSIRLMTKHSFILIHELRGASYGKFSALKDDAVNNNALMKALKDVYLSETKISEKEIDEILSHDVYWDLETCKKYGLVTGAVGEEILPEKEDVQEAIKEAEEEIKKLKAMLPKKKILPKKPARKPAPKEKSTKQVEK